MSSVFKLDYPEDKYEVIVVDAGSTDRTLEIVKSFPVDKVVVTKGATRGEARDKSVKEAKGEIIAVLDSDEYIPDEGWLAKAVMNFDDPQIALVVGRDLVRFIDEGEGMGFVQKVLFLFSYGPQRAFFKEES